ncbi:hemolysin III family protein [Sulfurimonas sp. HSL1-6]|uniref:PAQR family membrane homeostasis protein TrhA n=1 Tax=Thiomicrolovo immobilis TaxID=3131935 RepID=UPI0031F94A46
MITSSKGTVIKQNINSFSIAEEIWHAVTHGLGLLLSIAAMSILTLLAAQSGSGKALAGALVFGIALILMYGISTLYHAVTAPMAKRILQQLDHSAIYLLIAGTYTPVSLLGIQGAFGWIIFGVEWGVAALGIYLKVAYHGRFETLSLILYALMGWLVLVAAKPMLAHVDTLTLSLLLAGGLTYTLGIIFYVWDSLHLNHAVWHLFVLGGSIFHFFVVLFLIPSR